MLELVAQRRQVLVRARPLFLPRVHLGVQLAFPVPQLRGGLEVLGLDRVLLVPADLPDLAVQVAHVRPVAHPLLQGAQARLHRVQALEDLGQLLALPAAGRAGALLRLPRLTWPGQPLADRVQGGAQPGQHLGGGALAGADQAQQDVLGRDAVAAELHGLPHGQLQRLLGPRRERDVPGPRSVGPPADDPLDLLAHHFQADPERLQRLRRRPGVLQGQPEQDVLGTYVVVLEQPGLFLGQDQNPPRPVGEPLEHLPVAFLSPSPAAPAGPANTIHLVCRS